MSCMFLGRYKRHCIKKRQCCVGKKNANLLSTWIPWSCLLLVLYEGILPNEKITTKLSKWKIFAQIWKTDCMYEYLWCYIESISRPIKLKNMPDYGNLLRFVVASCRNDTWPRWLVAFHERFLVITWMRLWQNRFVHFLSIHFVKRTSRCAVK